MNIDNGILKADVLRVVDDKSAFKGDRLRERMFGYASDTKEIVVKYGGEYEFFGLEYVKKSGDTMTGPLTIDTTDNSPFTIKVQDKPLFETGVGGSNAASRLRAPLTIGSLPSDYERDNPLERPLTQIMLRDDYSEANVYPNTGTNKGCLYHFCIHPGSVIHEYRDWHYSDISTPGIAWRVRDAQMTFCSSGLLTAPQLDIKGDINSYAVYSEYINATELNEDGVKLSYKYSSINHGLAGHPVSGLTAGHVLRATGAESYAFGQVQWGDVGGKPVIPAAANISTNALSTTVTQGTAATFARSDHAHAIPAAPAGTNQQANLASTTAANSLTASSIGVTGRLPFGNFVQGSGVLGKNTSGNGDAAYLAPTAANTVLRSTAANAYSWGALVADDIPSLNTSKLTAGTLGVARGGTGLSTLTAANRIPYSTSATAMSTVAPSAAAEQVLKTSASGGAPSWGTVATGGIADDAVTNAKIRNSAALSVIGRSANNSGDPADIAAGSDHQVLRRSGSTLAFGAINLSQANAVTGRLPAANMGPAIQEANHDINGVTSSSNTITAINAGFAAAYLTAAQDISLPISTAPGTLLIIQNNTGANRAVSVPGGGINVGTTSGTEGVIIRNGGFSLWWKANATLWVRLT